MKIKQITAFLLVISSIFTIRVSAHSGDSSWYIKRNGTKQPVISEEQKIIYNYNGYYIDKKYSDTSCEKRLYLTFDAGYENGNISKILDTLKEESVPAAFFILSNLLLKDCDVVKRMIDEGHIVANHTKNHKNISTLTEEETKQNLLALERLCEEKTGYIMPKYFRFPEGKYSKESLDRVNKLGYKTIFWSLAYEDWDNNKQPAPNKALNKLLSNTHNGAVILLHPNSETNATILPILIKEWKKMGYSFGTLDELTQ